MANHSTLTSIALACILAGSGCGSANPADGGDSLGSPEGETPTDEPSPGFGGSGSQPSAPTGGTRSSTIAKLDPLGAFEPGSGEWQTLLEHHWDLDPGSEAYHCMRRTATEDIYISAFETIAGVGTHHTLLSLTNGGSDRVFRCSSGSNAFGRLLHESGTGPEPLEFPPGVAALIPAGTAVELNMHLFNTAPDVLESATGTRVKVVAKEEVEHVARSVLVGPLGLVLPPREETTISSTCVMGHDLKVFAAGPHMHLLGKHSRLTARSSIEGEVVLFDTPYDFDQQTVHSFEPVEMAAGDELFVECTFLNDTDRTVTFGESTLEEMCFAAVYIYPAGGGGLLC